ncbi:MAG: sigma factor-like helix-turn-helix DNA-binding protein [Peptostreptococcaceae bacterium]
MTEQDLEQFLSIKCEIEELQEEEQLLEEQKTSIKSQIISDMPRGGACRTIDDLIATIEDIKLTIARKRADLATEILRIENTIENLESIERRIIRYKYISNWSFSQIGKKLDYSSRHARRLHSEILEKIA